MAEERTLSVDEAAELNALLEPTRQNIDALIRIPCQRLHRLNMKCLDTALEAYLKLGDELLAISADYFDELE